MNLQVLISKLSKDYPDVADALANISDQLDKQAIEIKELQAKESSQRLNTLRLLSWL